MASPIFNWKLVEAELKIVKQFSEQRKQQIFRTSQVFKDVGIFVREEMFTDSSDKVSVGCIKLT